MNTLGHVLALFVQCIAVEPIDCTYAYAVARDVPEAQAVIVEVERVFKDPVALQRERLYIAAEGNK